MKNNLCKCNMCDSILIDANPQIGADEIELVGGELEMEFGKDVLDNNDIHWICPICKTDSYLTDL